MWKFFYKRPTIHYWQRNQQTHRDTDRQTETQRQQYLVNGETTIREYSSFSTIIFRFSHCFSPVCVCKGEGAGQARGRIQESRVDLQGERRSQTQPFARKLGLEAKQRQRAILAWCAKPNAQDRWRNRVYVYMNSIRVAKMHGPQAWATHGHARQVLPLADP